MVLLDFVRSSLRSSVTSRSRRNHRPGMVEFLESRLLLTAPTLTDSEQYLLELVNRARANPTAEAARYGIGLNDGLSSGTISTAAKQPLTPQQQLMTAAGLHSQDMLDRDYFSHDTLGSGTTFDQRVTNQGYIWNRVAENIGYSAKTFSATQTVFINEVHEGLIRSAGHRENIMDPNVEEVGIGARLGSFKPPGNPTTFDFTEMVTENFGSRNLGPFITGVVYTDTDSNNFYTIGESIRSGSVSAYNVTTGVSYSDTIGVSGAYGFVVPAGTYTISAQFPLGGSTRVVQRSGSVAVGSSNVKVDIETNSTALSSVSLTLTSSVNSLNESGATTTSTMTLTRSGDLGTTVTVNLASSDTTEITVPASISIPAGRSSVEFTATAVDDGIIDGTQQTTINASLTGYSTGSVALSVVDRTYPVLPTGIQTVETSRPTFTWSSISNAATYEIYVNNVTTNETRVINTTGITTNTYTSLVDLPIGTYYVWVRGFTSTSIVGPWSAAATWKLRPTTIVLNSGRTESSSSFRIDWTSIPGASTYDIWINHLTSNTSQYLRNTAVTTNSLSVTNFQLGRYAIWVRGRNSASDFVGWSPQAIINVNVAASGLSVSAANLTATPSLFWSSVAGATLYDVWIDNLTTATSAVVRNPAVAGTSLVLNSLPAASYRAWVRARDVNGAYYQWSSAFDFEVQRAPRVTAPSGNGQPVRPVFVWSAVAGANRYEIWLSNLTTSTVVTNNSTLSTTTFTPSADLTPGTYRVWIRAFDSSNTATAWSFPVTFTVVSNSGQIPALDRHLPPDIDPTTDSNTDQAFVSAEQWLLEQDFAAESVPTPRAPESDQRDV